MKKGTKGLVLTILSAVFAVLALIMLALPFAGVVFTGAKASDIQNLKFGEWSDMLKLYKKAGDFSALGLYSFSKVLLIIALIVMCVSAVLLVVQLFVNVDILRKLTKVFGILTVVLVPVFFVVLFLGGVIFSSANFDGNVVYAPNTGSCFIFIFGLVSGILTLVANKKEKAAAAE